MTSARIRLPRGRARTVRVTLVPKLRSGRTVTVARRLTTCR